MMLYMPCNNPINNPSLSFSVEMFFDVIRGLFEVSANGGDGHRGQDGGDGTTGRDSGRSVRSMHTFFNIQAFNYLVTTVHFI